MYELRKPKELWYALEGEETIGGYYTYEAFYWLVNCIVQRASRDINLVLKEYGPDEDIVYPRPRDMLTIFSMHDLDDDISHHKVMECVSLLESKGIVTVRKKTRMFHRNEFHIVPGKNAIL